MKEEINLSVCPICNKKFKKHYSQICCSDKCKLKRKKLKEVEYRKRNLKYFADKTREYAHNNKDKIREKAKRVYEKDREKCLIRAKTRNENRLTGFCNDCLTNKKTEFHHLSYKPIKIIEVCRKCHNKRHGRNYYGN